MAKGKAICAKFLKLLFIVKTMKADGIYRLCVARRLARHFINYVNPL